MAYLKFGLKREGWREGVCSFEQKTENKADRVACVLSDNWI